VEWFIGQAVSELQLSWSFVAPVVEAHGEHLRAVAREAASVRAVTGPGPVG
jgi:hypothetical protein